MNTKRKIFSLAVLLALAFAQFASPQPVGAAITRYAVPTGGLTSGACDSWANACDLQTAINSAAGGDQVWAQVGTYYPTVGAGRAATFTLRNGIAVYGGFTYGQIDFNNRSTNPALTILSGDLGTLGSVGDNAYHVVTIDNVGTSTRLDTFTVTQGYVMEADGNPFGGGFYITNSSPTLNNLIISNNQAGNTVGSGGGGIYINDTDILSAVITPIITNVTFLNNRSGRGGGLFSQNANPQLTNVTFDSNEAIATGGGGMNSQTVGSFDPPIDPKLTNVTFINNLATGGGGLFIGNSFGELTNVTFSGNTARRRGGGLLLEFSTAVLTNVTFYNNVSQNLNTYADPRGGGGLMNIAGSPTLNNVTFSGNTSNANGVDGSGMRNARHPDSPAVPSNPVIKNSIFWDDNSTEITHDNSGTVTIAINDSVVEGGCPAFSGVTCNNVISADPVLGALASNGGYTQTMALGVGSSAIDAGNDATCAATDQRGVTRPKGSHCDIGAYELEVLPQTLTVDKLGNGTGVVTSAPTGINCGADCSEDYAANTLVSLTATADPGSTFTYWSDLSCLDANPCVVTMDAAKTISAMFRIPAALISPSGTETAWDKTFEWTGITGASRYYLEMLKADDTLVHRKWYDAATYCSGLDCAVTVSELGNLPNGGYKWRILDYGPYGPAPFGYGIWSEFTTFTLGAPCYTLTTAVNLPGSGTVNTSAQNCTGGYTAGTVVQVSAVPNAGYVFSNWSGDAGGSGNPVSVTMTGNKSVTANLREASATLNSPAGTVPNWNGSFDWDGVTGAMRYYLEVQKADNTLVHRRWYEAATYCSGLDCVVTPAIGSLPNGDYKWRVLDYGLYGYGSWTAFTNFKLDAACYTLTTAVNIPGSGTVTTSAQNCAGGYTAGTVVQLTAVPNAGYVLTNWSGDAGGSGNPVSVTMTGNKSVTANLREASATLISPAGALPSWNGSFQWSGVTGGSRYYLELLKVDNTLVHRKWYYADVSCVDLTCVVTPALGTLPAGDYKWRILDYGAYGYGSWTNFTNFTLP